MQAHHAALSTQLMFALLLSASAGAQERESRPLSGFDAIEIGGGIDLFVRQGTAFAVDVEADNGELAEIVTEVSGKTLTIRRKSSFNFFHWGDEHGSVNVTPPTLVSLKASGGSDVTTQGTFTSDNIEVAASGGSDVEVAVAAGALRAQASGGSDLRLTGTARSASVQSSGGSDLNASRLTVDVADVESSGGSDLSIGVREKITGNASGGSDITYTGQPATVDVDTGGGAEVHHR
jgi:hypothetical protein